MRSEAITLSIDAMEALVGVTAKNHATCAEHGAYISITSRRQDAPSGCPACAEIRQREQDRADQDAALAKQATDRLQRRLGGAMIPRRFVGKAFADYRAETPAQKKCLSTCEGYADNFAGHFAAGRCLLLLGKPGTGKTHLATAIAGRVIKRSGHTAVYRSVAGILQHVKGSYSHGAAYSEADAFASMVRPSLLVIDEVGATKPTEFEQATLFAIINARYEDQRPTIVVSNLMPEELPAILGERSVDRLREGGGIALVFDWQSVRREIGAPC